MSIIRAPRPASGFTVLDNRLINDQNLGWHAKGLLIYLLSKPDHWQVSVAQLCNHTDKGLSRRSGRDAVYSILREIEQAGYVSRRPKRGDDGNFIGTEYVVSETPRHTEKPDAVPHTENPDTVKPDAEEPDAVNPTQVSTDLLERTEGEKELIPRDERIEEAFELFYGAGLVKKSKQPAFSTFKRLVKGKDPIEFAQFLADDIRKRLQFCQIGIDKLHPSTYLNQSRWTDDLVDDRPDWLKAQKSPGEGDHLGNNGKAMTPTGNVSHERLSGKDYAHGATADQDLPAYLRG